MKTTYKTLAAATFALLFLAACGSSGNMGDILGSGPNNGTYSSEIRGTVDSVDLNSGSIDLINVSGNSSMLSSGGGSTARVFFDNRTSVDYNGRSYHPEDLERGDQVAARVDQSNNRLYATSMSVLYDVRTRSSDPSGNYPNDTYGTTVHGSVRSVDTSRRTITLDDSYGRTTTVQYSTNTPVTYNGQRYSPADLETGDEIDVRVDNLGGGQYAARDITVTRSVSNNGSYGSTTRSTIRGTVRYVDTTRRTIELDSVTATNFNRGSGSTGTFIVQYDPNTQVNVQGQLYPISGLERGDVIEVQVDNLGNGNYIARQINLVRDVNR
ncbi:MAG: DUF5666 domain-containing protein [Thermoanaerobaculia bacterium]